MKKLKRVLLFVCAAALIFALCAFHAAADAEPGDVDGNGRVDTNDAIYLLYNIFFPDRYPTERNCDFDGSGVVDSNDAIYLVYNIFFPEKYPLKNPSGAGSFDVGTDTGGGSYGPFIPFH